MQLLGIAFESEQDTLGYNRIPAVQFYLNGLEWVNKRIAKKSNKKE